MNEKEILLIRGESMSMYDNSMKDNLYDEIVWFLNNYRDEEPVTTLLKMVTKAIEIEDKGIY